MSDTPLFQNADEQERIYAPQQSPEERARVVADEGADALSDTAEPPTAAPVANVGTTPSGMAAPPNIGDSDTDGAPGDPQTRARDPFEKTE